ncbi:DUF5959 family protein [Streptomyces avidinii]|uniref:Immunity protein 8 of polymorphic toxin system n=1 Tax=Streptomyces avidinii TaxID=1895 RepID=A0ABS4KYC5_STRAV|nr:DUF5959 family protein [Streptomyces avidinii]MBP2035041.1 hypothetical protein [Streptomyces avidinii]GGY90729.1 hypothetical protein GCM10010343_15260 [Streptomyces avidinii]
MTADLIRLVDGDSSVGLRVLGRHRPGGSVYNDHLDAEIVVTSGIANGRLRLRLSPEDLDDWAEALGELAVGRGIRWPRRGNGIRVEVDRRVSTPVPVVTVTDEEVSASSVRLRLDVVDGWVEQLRRQYHRVREAWPNEVVVGPRPRSYWQ